MTSAPANFAIWITLATTPMLLPFMVGMATMAAMSQMTHPSPSKH